MGEDETAKLGQKYLVTTAPAEAGALRVLPKGKASQQRIAVGDSDGMLQSFTYNKGKQVIGFRNPPTRVPVKCVTLGEGVGQEAKIFYTQSRTVYGIKKKGNSFFAFTTDLTSDIEHVNVHADALHCCTHSTYHCFSGQNLSSSSSFTSPGSINSMALLTFGERSAVPILGCDDRRVRIARPDCSSFSEVSIRSPVNALAHKHFTSRSTGAHGDDGNSILYGTASGDIGELYISEERVKRTRLVPNTNGARGAVTALTSRLDLLGDGYNDIIVGRDDGQVELYTRSAVDGSWYLYAERAFDDSVLSIDGGCVTRSEGQEAIVHTFSGKVLSLTPNQEDQAMEDPLASAASAKQSDQSAHLLSARSRSKSSKQHGTKARQNDQHVQSLRAEIESLQIQARERRKQYESLVKQASAPAPQRFHHSTSLTLNLESGTQELFVETPFPIGTLALQSDVPVSVIERSNDSFVVSVPRPQHFDTSSAFLATFRSVNGDHRLTCRLRISEGHSGTLRAYVIPKSYPMMFQTISYGIKPLCMHWRADEHGEPEETSMMSNLSEPNHALAENRDGLFEEDEHNELEEQLLGSKQQAQASGNATSIGPATDAQGQANERELMKVRLTGSFTRRDLHSWLSTCLPEMPNLDYKKEFSHIFKSALFGTMLIIRCTEGLAELMSDNPTALSYAHEAVTREATNRKIRVEASFSLNEGAYMHMVELLIHRIQRQLSQSNHRLIEEGLRELELQEEDLSFLSDEYKAILDHSESAKVTSVQQDAADTDVDVDLLVSMAKDVFVHWNRFRGMNVKNRVSALERILREGTADEIRAFMLGNEEMN